MVTVPQQPAPLGITTSPPTGPVPIFFEGTVGVADMPAWLKQVPNGAVLQASVQGRLAQNTYSLLTAQGPITISSSLALQAGTQLLFQIGPELQSQRMQLIGGTNPNPLPQPLPSPALGTASALPLPQAAAGQTLNAIVIRPADPAPLPTGPGQAPAAPAAPPVSTVAPQAGVAAYAQQTVTATAIAPMVLPSTPATAAGARPAAAPPLPGDAAPLAPTSTGGGTGGGTGGIAPGALPTLAPFGLSPRTGTAVPPTETPLPSAGTPPLAGSPSRAPATPAGSAAILRSDPLLAPRVPQGDLSVFAVTQAGEQVTVRIVSVTPPQTDAAVDARAGAPRSAPALTTPAATTPATTPTTPFSLFRDGLAALLSGLAADAPSATSGHRAGSSTSPLPSGPTLTGTVIGNGAQNRPIIAVGSAILSLEAGPLQPGAQVQLIAQLNAPAAASPALANPTQAQSPVQGFPTYPSLPAMVAAAQQIGGPTEQAILAMMPRIGPQLAASLMIFASGAAKGDLRTLVGDSARAALERTPRGRAALAGAVREFQAAEQEARGTPAADWRALTLPVMTGGAAIEPIRLYLHQVSDEEAERNRQKEGGGQRFVLDLDLTQLGSIQIDGLAKQDRLDLVVRTPKPLPEHVREGLRSAFLGGAVARGVIGGLTFQVAPRFVPDTGQAAVRRGGMMV